ncbi:MAG: pilus assembly protein [Candidatus Eiseniibacteriota bacterium]|nr:MAG: pilus assembly protein [Candidatus Eisenbacteria bacterium]
MRKLFCGPRSQRGAALVEFALVAFMLFVVIVAMAEFSRAWMILGVANGAARVGARYAAILPDVENNLDSVRAKVRDVLIASQIPDGDIHVDVVFDTGSPAKGEPFTVNVVVDFHTSFGNLFPRLDELPLKASCSMRREI